MRTPAPAEQPTEASGWTRGRILLLTLVVSAVVVVAVIALILLQPGPPLRLLSVTSSPDPAVPDQTLTVTAQAQGGTFLAPLSVSLDYNCFFACGVTGGASMRPQGGGTYAATIGPFPNGSALWLVVTASDGYAFQRSDSLTVEVGEVPQGGASGLKLNSVLLTPPRPTSLDLPVVTVNVTSAASIAAVPFAYMWFYVSSRSRSSGGGSADLSLLSSGKGNYTSMPLMGLMGGPNMGTTVGTVWLYRVGAVDSTGNTVLSPAYNFTVASP